MTQVFKVKKCNQGGYSWSVESFVTGKRRRKFFRSIREAKTWAELRNIEFANSGLNSLSVSDEMRVDFQRALTMLQPYGKTLLEAVAAALPVFQAQGSSRPVRDVVEALQRAKKAEGMSARYLGDMKSRLGFFVRHFGDRPISLIGTRETKEWLRTLDCGPVAKNNMRRLLSVLWSFALEAEWCEENIIKRVKGFSRPPGRIGILSPEEAARLLAAASPKIAPLLALGLFAGLRRSELLRTSWVSVRLASGLIEVSVTKTKTAARRFVRVRQNLRAWMLACPNFPSLQPKEFQTLLSEARAKACLSNWPNNAMRHSFCSYALAGERNLGDLTLEMGHTNPHTLFAHYRELCAPQDAEIYWRLTPARVRRFGRTEF